LETVQKLRWSPDIIHCHGWFTHLVPLFIKTTFKDNPLFKDSKLIYSIYNDEFSSDLDSKFRSKLDFDGIGGDDVNLIETPSYENITKLAVNYSDGIIFGNENINENAKKFVIDSGKPTLEYLNNEEYIDAYSDFYDKILSV